MWKLWGSIIRYYNNYIIICVPDCQSGSCRCILPTPSRTLKKKKKKKVHGDHVLLPHGKWQPCCRSHSWTLAKVANPAAVSTHGLVTSGNPGKTGNFGGNWRTIDRTRCRVATLAGRQTHVSWRSCRPRSRSPRSGRPCSS